MNKQKVSRLLAKAVMTGAAGLLLAWALGEAQAANRWYSARTVNGRTQPLSAGTETMLLPDGRIIGVSSASVTNGLVDIVISLYNNPQGDDNGNTQDADPASVAQDAYEKVIQYTADALYEATEGAHSFRNVRIYRNASRPDADVIWQQAGGPSAWYMNQHYLYGVLDEYCRWNAGWVTLPANEKTQPCIMNNQWAAAGRVYSWLNHSIAYNTNSVTYAPYECRNTTAQYQHYNDGAWPTLSRSPSNDPLDTARRQWLRTNRGARMYYPELAGVSPTGTNPPGITLNSGTAVADLPSRDNLNIIWMGSNIVMEIILDISGSMGYEAGKFENAKVAAQLLVDQVPTNSAVGVITFDDSVYTTSPIITITSAVQRTTIKNAIAALATGGATAIGDAALEGLSQIVAFGHTNFTRVAFLLSDGQSNTGADPLTAAAAYQTAQIPIMTFGYGPADDIDSRLITMADMTGGTYYYSPVSLGAIAAAFNNALASIQANATILDGFYLASATALNESLTTSVSIPFQVDSTIADLNISVSYTTNNTATLTVNAPNGTAYPPSSTNASGSERLLSYSIDSPATGQWAIAGSVTTGATLRYSVIAGVTGFSYYLTAVSVAGNTVTYPDPISIIARLQRGPSIKGAVVRAVITDPNSNTTYLALSNTNNDGTYSGIYLASNGLHTIVVEADNSAGTATYTWSDTLPAVDSDGNVPITPDSAVGEPFSRSASLQVTMEPEYYAIVPLTPANVTASDGAYLGYVDVNWKAEDVYNQNASLYEIWRSTEDSSASATKIGEIDRTYTNYMDSSVDVETRYYYWVKARNFVGDSAFSSSDQGWPIFGPAIRVNNARTVAYADSLGLLYYLNSAGVWTQAFGVSDIHPVYQGGIFDIDTPYTVFLYNGLPEGVYHFYFGLDWTVDGLLSFNTIVYDGAVLTIAP
ncbi:MAG: VWA domain-containing protein [Lentisphaerae bacterium]|nr:VWA domain-containing protein [Lentisphaerota bacterium]